MNKTYQKLLNYAKRVCGCGTCSAPFECDHANHVDGKAAKFGTTSVCPMARYHIEPGDYEAPTLDDVHVLCLACQHAVVTVRKKERVFVRKDYVDVCVDCPVKAAEDRIYETLAKKYI